MIARPPPQTRTAVAFGSGRPRHRDGRAARRCIAARLCAAAFALAAQAASAATLTVALTDLDGPGFSARNVTAELAPRAEGFAGVLRIGQLELPPPAGTFSDVTLGCGELRLHRNGVRCNDGRLQSPWPGIDSSEARLSLIIVAGGHVRMTLEDARLGGGRVSLTLNRRGDGSLQATTRLRHVDMAALPPEWAAGLPLPEGLQIDGRVDGNVVARIEADGRFDLRATTMPRQVGFADASGALAAEQVGMTVDAHAHGNPKARIDLRVLVRLLGGQAYVDPVFLDFDKGPVQLEILARRERPDAAPVLTRVRYRDRDVLMIDGRGALGTGGAGHFDLKRIDVGLADAWSRYAQPFVLGTALDALAPEGRIQASGRWQAGALDSIAVYLRDASLADGLDRLEFEAIGADVHWSRDGEPRDSWVQWSDGRVLRLPMGAGRIEARAAGDRVIAPGLQRVPVLDGALSIRDLEVTGLTGGTRRLRLDAALEPISLRLLTAALEWPEMRGTLAGSLPRMQYRDRTLSTDGTLRVRVFDGDISVDNLRIESLLGPLPRLEADVTMRELDLQTVTSTFAFGQISGRLDGELHGLRLVDWQPSAFRASFYTTPGYRGPRRISQRAIDNLSNIGTGGVGGALSGGFMRFFDEFNYAEIGLSCTLHNEVCRMGGAGPANGGYYIVRGRGLPRIDVIGSADRVAWPLLLRQLASLQQLDDAVVR